MARLPDLMADGAVFWGAPGSVRTGVGNGLQSVAFPRTVPTALTLAYEP
ncbi:hypothetical protein [Catenulispora rubra]|nr:hypothetical protein [Catenulispora rubra]